MPKAAKGKSSASSGTRKKNALKAAKKNPEDPSTSSSSKPKAANQPSQRGEKKSKKERKEALAKAKKKSYVPPPKAPQPPPDPLDSMGLAATLQPDLVVLLRKLGKKDVVTRERALEGLKNWLEGRSSTDGERKMVEDWELEMRRNDALVMLPSWLHLFPRLSISPTRKLRLLTTQILSSLLSIPEVRQELLFNPSNQESLLGPWSILTWDNDKYVSKTCKDLWDSNWSTIPNFSSNPAPSSNGNDNEKLELNQDTLEILLNHLNNVLLSESPSQFLSLTFSSQAPVSIHSNNQLNGNGGNSTPTSIGRDAKNRDEMNLEEGREDTDGRLKSGSLGCLNWILSTLSNASSTSSSSNLLTENLSDLLRNPKIYSSLINLEETSIPSLRSKTYQLLNTLNSSQISESLFKEEILEIISPEVSLSLWQEKDLGVIRNGIDSLLPIFRKYPSIWESQVNSNKSEDNDDEDDDDDEDSDSDSGSEDEVENEEEQNQIPKASPPTIQSYPSYDKFKQFLERGLSPAPQLSYPTILLFLTTIPSSILKFDHDSSNVLLESLFEPFGSRDLDSDNRGDINAFLTAFLECLGWLIRRILKEGERKDGEKLIETWFSKVWQDFVIGAPQDQNETRGEKDDDEDEEGEKEGRLNRKVRSYNSISNPKLSPEFGSVFKKVFNSLENDESLVRFLSFVKDTLQNSLKNQDKSRKEIEKIVSRSIGIFETLIKRGNTLNLNQDLLTKVQDLIQTLMNDSINSLNDDSSSELQQRNLIFLSNSITSRNLSSNLNLTDQTRKSLTLLSEEILPKIISDGKIGGQNHAELIGSIMNLLNSPRSNRDSSKDVGEIPSGSGTQVWIKALEASILLKDENQRVGNILQILQAEESSRHKEENSMPTRDNDEDDGEKPLDEISISLASEFCSSNNQKTSELEKLIQTLLLSGQDDGRISFAIHQEKIEEILIMLSSKISGVHSTFISYLSKDSNSKGSSKKNLQQTSQDYSSLIPVLRVFNAWISKNSKKKLEKLESKELFNEVPRNIFELSFLNSQDNSDSDLKEAQKIAAEIWLTFNKAQGKEADLLEIGRKSLSFRLEECEIPLDVIIGASRDLSGDSDSSHLVKLLPPVDEMEKLAVEVASIEPDSTLSILDPLVLSTNSSSRSSSSKTTKFDPQGFSIYSRLSLLLSRSIENDVRFAKSISSWIIPHLLLFSMSIEDKLSNENESSNHLFNENCNLIELKTSFRNIIRSLTSLISSLCNDLSDDWHVQTVAILQREKGDGSKTSSEKHDSLRSALLTVYRLSKSSNTSNIQFARIFNKLLSGVMSFSSISSVDGERWLKLGQSLMIQFPLLSCSTFYSVKSLASSTPFYDRLRNDLASRLAGVPASKANDEGMKLLTLLLSVAPNAETGDIALIPQQRSIFLLQTFQKWFASDEDLEDELNCKLIELFIHLLPIVQDLQGSHLDLMFDLLETNLELVEVGEKETWGMIFNCLKLLDQIRDLSSSNKMLKAAWRERKDPIWEKVHDLFLELAPTSIDSNKRKSSSTSNSTTSLPREIVAELLVDLVREVPSSAFSNKKDEETLIRLMTGNNGTTQDGSVSREMQVVAYKLLNACISDKVRELVVEAAVGKSQQEGEEENAESSQSPQLDLTLPPSLLKIASASVNASTAQILLEDQSTIEEVDDEEEIISDLETAQQGRKTVFGLLLCWMAIFDHFEEASLQIRSAYLAQIEKMELTQGLASTVFNLLNGKGGRGSSNSFEAGKWGIEEVGLDDLDISNGLSLQALAAHVYLRSLTHLPTLVRSWWFSLKDRQLSMSVSNFTVKNCSPSIALRELSHLRREDSLSKLEDEAMTIKFQGSNEVIATYVVDEHPIEMGVKIPNDFPLHAIEIRDPADAGKRVGISESQWRAWILATQQLITSKNGLILDALMLFKKNAEAKFAGFEGAECAICYSIISPTDRSLPVKPCPTCKNRFHASCLFKWVTTSGSSTCPLCRSVI